MTSDSKLYSLSASSASVTACGVVTVNGAVARYAQTTYTYTQCGTLFKDTTVYTTKSVTAVAPSIAENTSSIAKTVNVTAYYEDAGVEKSVTISATQPAATVTGGTTTWNTDKAQAYCSTYFFERGGGSGTVGYVAPSWTKSAKVTGCATVLEAATSGNDTFLYWQVGNWSTSATDSKATISGNTLTVPKNEGSQRSAVITAYFSSGRNYSFTITQETATHVVDVE